MYVMRQRWAVRLAVFAAVSLVVGIPIGLGYGWRIEDSLLLSGWILTLCYSVRLLRGSLGSASGWLAKMGILSIFFKSLPGFLLILAAFVFLLSLFSALSVVVGVVEILRELIEAYRIDTGRMP